MVKHLANGLGSDKINRRFVKQGVYMTYKAYIKNGVAVLDGGVKLPEGTEVSLEPATGSELPVIPLMESFKDLIGKINDLPADAAANKRHYLYGHPKT